MTRAGFIGLGAMGVPMAANLLRAGHEVLVYSRRPQSAAPLVALGAQACTSPADVAGQSDIVFTMVTDTAAVEAVCLGAAGIVSGARPGTIVVDHSTIDPEVTRRIATELHRHGIEMLDAPVSGGVAGAQAGSLVMMVGGAVSVLDRCRPLLAANASRVVYMGPSGAGQVAKACNQMCIVVNQLGVAEALLVAERAGLDRAALIEALQGGFAASRVLELQGPKMAARSFEGRIESRLHHKDILMALSLAERLGVRARASALAAETLAALQERGGARLDSAAVFTIVEDGD
ncbi:MAG: NAD(P)-dependent oxidoreductase [Vicinamibacterales bacterium]